MKILFDTNVLFAAFISHGVCNALYEEVLLKGQLVVSESILEELQTKLISKAKLTKQESMEVVAAIRSDADVVESPPFGRPICRDSEDDHILSAALHGKVDILVTGDRDLLVLKSFQAIPILTPRECLECF